MVMQIKLSHKKPSAGWDEQSLFSIEHETVYIHCQTNSRYPLRRIQAAARCIALLRFHELSLIGKSWDLNKQWAFAKGIFSPKQKTKIHWNSLNKTDSNELQQRLAAHRWVQSQINLSAEDLSPMQLATNAAQWIASLAPDAVNYDIISGTELAEQGWTGVYNVGRGSARPPAILKLEYCPQDCLKDPVAVALVGKGIVFDSGGYSMKQSEAMLSMKSDMGGAATLTGAFALAIQRGLRRRVMLILCCAENLVSGHAYKLGDILHYKNGVSVEIVNTDAEGRLVLADGLIMAAESKAQLIIDAATLTGAAVVGLGADYNAIFSLDKSLQQRALDYADSVDEPHWPLPLELWHQDKCPSAYADTANSRPIHGGGPGGASNAAGFLSRFVPHQGRGWLHFDLAAAFHHQDETLYSAGATAQGMLTIARLLETEI